VSILTGLGFAAYDIAKGDYAHAAVDVLSGIVGSVPFVGPLLGIATDYVGDLVIDKYRKSKASSKTNVKVKNKSTERTNSHNTVKPKYNSYRFSTMVRDEVNSIKSDPSFLPKEIKFYNNKYKENVPVITINKNSYTDKDGKEKSVPDIYKLRRAYAKFIVASSQGIDSTKYQKQISAITNGQASGNVSKTSASNPNSVSNPNSASGLTSTSDLSASDSSQQVDISTVPNLIFANNEVKIGPTIYPSNPIIEKDYNDYKMDKTPDNIEKVLEDIKTLKSAKVKDNTPSKVNTLASIFKHNQAVQSAQKDAKQTGTVSDIGQVNNDSGTHINIVQPAQEGARLMDTYQ